VVIGSGIRGSKLRLPGRLLAELPGAHVLDGLGIPVEPRLPDTENTETRNTETECNRGCAGTVLSVSWAARRGTDMKRLAIAAVIAAGALGITLTAVSSATATTQRPATTQKQNVVVLDCLTKPRVEPRTFVLTCADGNAYLDKLSWTSWTPRMATATGVFARNDCIPSCVGGHFHSYPVLAVLWGPVAYHHGQRLNKLTLIFPGARPAVFNGHKWVPGPVTVTNPLWGSN
jgi:hypothetical protein